MKEVQLIKHEDGVKLTIGMTGKMSIEVHVYEETPELAIEKAFDGMRLATNKAVEEGYKLVEFRQPPAGVG